MVVFAFFFLCLNFLCVDVQAANYKVKAGNKLYLIKTETEDSLTSKTFTQGTRVIQCTWANTLQCNNTFHGLCILSQYIRVVSLLIMFMCRPLRALEDLATAKPIIQIQIQRNNLDIFNCRGTLAIFNEKYPGFSDICRWAISADTVSENNKMFIETVLLT